MQNAIGSFENIKKEFEIFNPHFTLLCIDFDGTLAKIQKNPYAAYLENEQKETIKKLSNIENVYYCIVTGRKLSDIKKRVGLSNNIIYSGNHGFEIKSYYRDVKINFLAGGLNSNMYKNILESIENDLRKKIKITNLIIENKKFSISLHFRMLNPEDTKKLKKETKDIFNSNSEYKKLLRLKRGKKILEVRPKLDWDKGKACEYIAKKLAEINGFTAAGPQPNTNGALNIFRFNMGDDLSDETMFVKKKYDIESDSNKTSKANVLSISCVVGKKKSLADYYVNDYTQTHIIMQKLTGLFLKAFGMPNCDKI